MILKDISFKSPEENICFDEALLQLADKHNHGEFLRFWESPTIFIVLGRIGKTSEDVDMDLAKADGIPVLHRSSGGGTVVQGPGCLNYSVIINKNKDPQLHDLKKSYEWVNQRVIDALQALGIQAHFRPTSDLAVGPQDKKFSGNAQKRGRTHILHHGTILYNFDLNLVPKYLKMPKDIPEYRKNRNHHDFVTNISMDPKLFKTNLAKNFGVTKPSQPLSDAELSFLKDLLK